MSVSANIFEVFSGIQGEGIAVGRRQVFVRFAGCNLSCSYCDTPGARGPVPFARVERAGGGRDFEQVENPFSAPDLAEIIRRLDPDRRHDSISLTGGEPLLAADFIAELAPLCGPRRLYLETNGTLPRELEKVIGLVDTIAMDIKLRSGGGAADPKTSGEFLSIAAERDVFVKLVVSGETGPGEVAEAARVVAGVGKQIPFVIQPVTPTSPEITPPSPTRLLELQMSALGVLDDVRVIPQLHKLMGQM